MPTLAATGPGFLDPRQLKRRADTGAEWRDASHADPVPAILQFSRALAERGSRLILLPAPTKAVVHPERFSARFGPHDGPVQNPSWALLRRKLEREGVLVFDPTPLLARRAAALPDGMPQFLRADTHWRPEAVQAVAAALSEFIQANVDLPEEAPVEYVAHDREVESLGDLATILKLPADQNLFVPERVIVRQVRAPGGDPWRPSPSASVLLLGDSFTNIYSVGLMGWGESAGLAEQLSMELHRPVDRIAINDDGAWATRAQLAGDLARGHDRLAGKKVVVWQVAVRELAVGDWRPIGLAPAPAARERAFYVPIPGKTVILKGMVRAISKRPDPGAVYADHVMTCLLVDLMSDGEPAKPAEAVVHMLSMKARKLLPPAGLQIGRIVTVRLRPWEDVEDTFGGLRRSLLANDDALLADPCWGEVTEQ